MHTISSSRALEGFEMPKRLKSYLGKKISDGFNINYYPRDGNGRDGDARHMYEILREREKEGFEVNMDLFGMSGRFASASWNAIPGQMGDSSVFFAKCESDFYGDRYKDSVLGVGFLMRNHGMFGRNDREPHSTEELDMLNNLARAGVQKDRRLIIEYETINDGL